MLYKNQYFETKQKLDQTDINLYFKWNVKIEMYNNFSMQILSIYFYYAC